MTAGARTGVRLDRRPLSPVPIDAEAVFVPMRDRVRLASDVYLSRGARRRTTVLARLPYDKNDRSSYMPWVARWFRERGYAVVVQEVRGKLRSEGRVAPFVAEPGDGYDTIDWIVRQPWSNGSVVMVGDSYYGYTQWAAAASGHPALRAISPRVTSLEVEADWVTRQGVFCLQTMVDWVLHTWLDEHLYNAYADWSTRPLREIARVTGGDLLPVWLDAWATGRVSAPRLEPANVPALHLAGSWDVFSRGQLATWRRAIGAGNSSQHLMFGARDHTWLPLARGSSFVDPRLDDRTLEPFVDEYLAPLDSFFRHVLDGGGAPPPVRYEIPGRGWLESECWPPRACQVERLFADDAASASLGPEGGDLASKPARVARWCRWEHDPLNPVPSLSSNPWEWLAEETDERDVEVRPDVLTFTSDELQAPLDMAGPARVVTQIAASTAICHLAAKLVVVDPTGEALRVLDGIVAAEPARDPRVVVELGDMAYRIETGQRLRLELAGSCFPRYAVDPGTGANPWSEESPRASTLAVAIGGSNGLCLELTTLIPS